MLRPTTIEFSSLVVGQFERAFTLRIRETFPKGHGEFRPIPGRELKELGKRTRCHALIVSRVNVASQYPETMSTLFFVASNSCVWPRLAFSGLTAPAHLRRRASAQPAVNDAEQPDSAE